VNCEEIREDLEAFALRAMEPAEMRAIELHIVDCEDCAQIVRAYRMAIDHLALAVPLVRAPTRLKSRVLGGVGVRPLPVPKLLTSKWVLGTAAAALVALAVGVSAWAMMLSTKVDNLREDNARLAELTQLDAQQRSVLLQLQGELNSARTEQRRMSTTLDEQATLLVIALDPDLIPSELQGTSLAPAASCGYVWSSKQSVGALTCRDLPTTAFFLNYELWATKGDKTVPLGTFLPRTDGTASLLVKFPEAAPGPVVNMWVTLEQSGMTRTKPSDDVVLNRSPDQQAAR
jgi:hypothetical protein